MSVTIGPDGRPTGTVYVYRYGNDPACAYITDDEGRAIERAEKNAAEVWVASLAEAVRVDLVPPVPARFVPAGTPLPTGEPARDENAALNRMIAALDSVAAGGDAFLPDVEAARLGLLAEDGTARPDGVTRDA